MKIIIVEDEQHNSRMLAGMIKKARPDWQLEGTFESVKKTVQWLQENPMPELIFMDIQLTDGISFSIFEQVQIDSMIIFTTAFDEYAIQAFDVNSIDYLLKPIKQEKLTRAIEKFEQITPSTPQAHEQLHYQDLLEAVLHKEKKYRKRFLVAGAADFFKIEAQNVAYFYAENRETFAVTFEGKEHILDLTLEKIEEQVDPTVFFRANRSAIINSEAIRKFENYFGGKLIVRLVKPFDEPITISRLKSNAFKEWLDS